MLRIEREAAMLGGAGNVLRNLVALGAAVEFLAVVGDDAAGRGVQALARGAAGEPGAGVGGWSIGTSPAWHFDRERGCAGSRGSHRSRRRTG